MKNYVKEYMGYKVPEGATHVSNFTPTDPNTSMEFYCETNGVNKYFSTGIKNPVWKNCFINKMNRWAIPLPENQEWNGEGLPTVDTECMFKSTGAGWRKCTVIAFNSSNTKVWLKCNNIKDRLDCLENVKFKPLKSEKEKFIDEVCKTILKKDNINSDIESIASALFDAEFKAPGVKK